MTRWRLAWLFAVAAAAPLAAEWMRAPGWVLAAGSVLLAAAAWAALWRERRTGRARGVFFVGAALLSALAVATCVFTWRLGAVRGAWPRAREHAVTAASRRLERDLRAAFAAARALADQAAQVGGPPGDEVFRRLGALVRDRAPARAVVLFDAAGRPAAWAGTVRMPLSATGPELSTVTTPFYLWLVARRQTHGGGGTAVAAVLLARASYAPRTGVALTDRFAERAGVGLQFYQPGGAPPDSDVFYYVAPGGVRAGDTLFAVQPMPPEQDVAYSDLLASSRRAVFWLVAALLLVTGAGAVRAVPGAGGAVVTAAAVAPFLARAPLGEAFGPGGLFSSATYFQDVIGPFSKSTGVLTLTGFVVAVFACALWRRGLRPRWASGLAALFLIALAPYLLQDLARGITPPADGVSLGLWLMWQVGLVLAASALVLLAAALVRGPAVPVHGGLWPFLASALAVALAVAGLFLWEPRGAWPGWYPYLWLPALLVAVKPMPFRSTIATVAVVAGTSAALLEWGVTTQSRIALAARDLEGLGNRTDPLKVALFDRLIHTVPSTTSPQTASDLYLLWRRSDFAAHNYPMSLAVWSAEAQRTLALDLAQLNLPDSLVRTQVQEALRERIPLVRSYLLLPGVYGLATLPLSDGRVLAVAVGPQSELVTPSRVARLLAVAGEKPAPPYRLTMSPREPEGPPPPRVMWVRSGWTIRGERVLELPGGPRHVHAQVDLGGLSSLLQQGLLLLVLDFGVLAALWLVVELVSGRLVPNLRAWIPRVRRSLRARLTVSLAAFFVVPTVALAAWSYARQEDEFLRSRELLMTRTLRDAGAALEDATTDPARALGDVAENVDAELVLSQGGQLVASSAPLLRDLGLVDWLLPPRAFTRLAFGDNLELTSAEEDTPQPVLVGYRLLGQGGASQASILSSPQLLSDEALGAREEELGIAVLVAAVLGIVAAIFLSGLAARALARPLRNLADAALAAGTGARPVPAGGAMPSELEPVYRAIEQAAADVEKGHEAQRVLAWGEMARQVAHEIKNPLTPIRLAVQHIRRAHADRRPEFPKILEDNVDLVLAEIDRLTEIARAFSRYGAPSGSAGPLEAVDVGAVLRDALTLYRASDAQVHYVEEIAAPLLRGLTRAGELKEVLLNLVENARAAIDGHGTIGIRAHSLDGFLEVVVADDGPGIPPDLLPQIFEPHFSTRSTGTGLGLAIVRRLVESWGGEVTAESEPGTGTTMRVRIPVARNGGAVAGG